MATVELIGHRGAPRIHLENTLPSFVAAFDAGVDAVELDVHVTADGIPVVHHDARLGRSVQSRAFRRRAIRRLTWAQIRTVSLSSDPDADYRIPTLESVFDALGGRGTIYVEIKGGPVEPIVEVLRPRAHACAVHSANYLSVARFRTLAPAVPRGFLLPPATRNVGFLIRSMEARDVWPRWRSVSERLTDAIHGTNARVIPWTVNSRTLADRLIHAGADAVCSDDPELI